MATFKTENTVVRLLEEAREPGMRMRERFFLMFEALIYAVMGRSARPDTDWQHEDVLSAYDGGGELISTSSAVILDVPRVDGVPLEQWLRQVRGENVWQQVAQDFTEALRGNQEQRGYFLTAEGTFFQRHTMLVFHWLAGQGVTAQSIRDMEMKHTAAFDLGGNAITHEIYDAMVAAFLAALQIHSVPPTTLDQVIACTSKYRTVIVGS